MEKDLSRIIEFFSKGKKILLLLGYTFIVVVTILNWWPNYINFKNLIYPNQFRQEVYNYLEKNYPGYKMGTEFFTHNFNGIGKFPDEHYYRELAEPGKFYIVNAWDIYPWFGNWDQGPRFKNCKEEVLMTRTNPLSAFKPFPMEGHIKIMREQLIKDPLIMQLLYCKPVTDI